MMRSPHASAIPEVVTQLARLIWQPGRYMHARWWQALEMSAWQPVYRQRPATRASIDRELVARREWPNTASALGAVRTLSDAACAVLHLVPNLRRVALAHGVRAMGCPDYLLVGRYRRALAPWLDAWQCDRLLLTRRDWPTPSVLPPEQLVDVALAMTGAWLDETPVSASPDIASAHRAIRVLLPPGDSFTRSGQVPVSDAWVRLAALEKMLCMSSITR